MLGLLKPRVHHGRSIYLRPGRVELHLLAALQPSLCRPLDCRRRIAGKYINIPWVQPYWQFPHDPSFGDPSFAGNAVFLHKTTVAASSCQLLGLVDHDDFLREIGMIVQRSTLASVLILLPTSWPVHCKMRPSHPAFISQYRDRDPGLQDLFFALVAGPGSASRLRSNAGHPRRAR